MADALAEAAASALGLAGTPSPSLRANTAHDANALSSAGPRHPEKLQAAGPAASAEHKHNASPGGQREQLFPAGAAMLTWLEAPPTDSSQFKTHQKYPVLYEAAARQMRAVLSAHLARSDFEQLECRARARALDAGLSAALLRVLQQAAREPGEALAGVLSALVDADLPGAFVQDQANAYHWRLRNDAGFDALVAQHQYPQDVLARAEELRGLAERTESPSLLFSDKFRAFLDLEYVSLPAKTVSDLRRLSTGGCHAAKQVLKWHGEQEARSARRGGRGAELFPKASHLMAALESKTSQPREQCPEFWDAAVRLMRAVVDEDLASRGLSMRTCSARELRDHARALDAKLSAALLQVAQRIIGNPQSPGLKPGDAALSNVLLTLVTSDLSDAFVADQANAYHRRLRIDPSFGALVALQGCPHDVLAYAEQLNKLAGDSLNASPEFRTMFENFLDLDYASLPAATVEGFRGLQTPAGLELLEWQGAQEARSLERRNRRRPLGGSGAELFPSGAGVLTSLESTTIGIQKLYPEFWKAAVGLLRAKHDEHVAGIGPGMPPRSMRESRDQARALDANLAGALLQVALRDVAPPNSVKIPGDPGLTGVLSELVAADLPRAFVRDQAETFCLRLRTDSGFGANVALQGFPHGVLARAEELIKLAQDSPLASPDFKKKFEEFLDLDYKSLPANTVSAVSKYQIRWTEPLLKWHSEQVARGARSGAQRRARTVGVVGTALAAVQSLLGDTALPLHVRDAVRAICPPEHTPAQAREALRLTGSAVAALLGKSLNEANALSRVRGFNQPESELDAATEIVRGLEALCAMSEALLHLSVARIVQDADALCPATERTRPVQDAAVELARDDVFATGRAADVWALAPSALQAELLAPWLRAPPLHRAARVPYSSRNGEALRASISKLNPRISSVNARLQALAAPAGGAAGRAPTIQLESIWDAFTRDMPHRLLKISSLEAPYKQIEPVNASTSLRLHALVTEIDKRFIECITHLMTRQTRQEESVEEAKRVMHKLNGVMPKVFAAAGEAFAQWARTCEAQACDAVSWLASPRERFLVAKMYALWQQDRGPGGAAFAWKQSQRTRDEVDFAVLVRQLVDLNYYKVWDPTGWPHWEVWAGDRDAMRLKSAGHAHKETRAELTLRMSNARGLLARHSMSQTWALPLRDALTLFCTMWPKQEFYMTGETLGAFWAALSSTEVMAVVERAVSEAIKHVNAITAEVGAAGVSTVIAATHKDAVSRLEELVHVRAQLVQLAIAAYTLCAFNAFCTPVFASDERRARAHRLACARAAGSAADPLDEKGVADAVDALLFATAPDDTPVLAFTQNVFTRTVLAVQVFQSGDPASTIAQRLHSLADLSRRGSGGPAPADAAPSAATCKAGQVPLRDAAQNLGDVQSVVNPAKPLDGPNTQDPPDLHEQALRRASQSAPHTVLLNSVALVCRRRFIWTHAGVHEVAPWVAHFSAQYRAVEACLWDYHAQSPGMDAGTVAVEEHDFLGHVCAKAQTMWPGAPATVADVVRMLDPAPNGAVAKVRTAAESLDRTAAESLDRTSDAATMVGFVDSVLRGGSDVDLLLRWEWEHARGPPELAFSTPLCRDVLLQHGVAGPAPTTSAHEVLQRAGVAPDVVARILGSPHEATSVPAYLAMADRAHSELAASCGQTFAPDSEPRGVRELAAAFLPMLWAIEQDAFSFVVAKAARAGSTIDPQWDAISAPVVASAATPALRASKRRHFGKLFRSNLPPGTFAFGVPWDTAGSSFVLDLNASCAAEAERARCFDECHTDFVRACAEGRPAQPPPDSRALEARARLPEHLKAVFALHGFEALCIPDEQMAVLRDALAKPPTVQTWLTDNDSVLRTCFAAAGLLLMRNVELFSSPDSTVRRNLLKDTKTLLQTVYGGLSGLLVSAAVSLAPDLLPPALLRSAQALSVPQAQTRLLEGVRAADPTLERRVKRGLVAFFGMPLPVPPLDALRLGPAGLFDRLTGNPERADFQALHSLLRDTIAVRLAPCTARHSLKLVSTLVLWLGPAPAAPPLVQFFSVAAAGGENTMLAPEALSRGALADLAAEHEVPVDDISPKVLHELNAGALVAVSLAGATVLFGAHARWLRLQQQWPLLLKALAAEPSGLGRRWKNYGAVQPQGAELLEHPLLSASLLALVQKLNTEEGDCVTLDAQVWFSLALSPNMPVRSAVRVGQVFFVPDISTDGLRVDLRPFSQTIEDAIQVWQSAAAELARQVDEHLLLSSSGAPPELDGAILTDLSQQLRLLFLQLHGPVLTRLPVKHAAQAAMHTARTLCEVLLRAARAAVGAHPPALGGAAVRALLLFLEPVTAPAAAFPVWRYVEDARAYHLSQAVDADRHSTELHRLLAPEGLAGAMPNCDLVQALAYSQAARRPHKIAESIRGVAWDVRTYNGAGFGGAGYDSELFVQALVDPLRLPAAVMPEGWTACGDGYAMTWFPNPYDPNTLEIRRDVVRQTNPVILSDALKWLARQPAKEASGPFLALAGLAQTVGAAVQKGAPFAAAPSAQQMTMVQQVVDSLALFEASKVPEYGALERSLLDWMRVAMTPQFTAECRQVMEMQLGIVELSKASAEQDPLLVAAYTKMGRQFAVSVYSTADPRTGGAGCLSRGLVCKADVLSWTMPCVFQGSRGDLLVSVHRSVRKFCGRSDAPRLDEVLHTIEALGDAECREVFLSVARAAVAKSALQQARDTGGMLLRATGAVVFPESRGWPASSPLALHPNIWSAHLPDNPLFAMLARRVQIGSQHDPNFVVIQRAVDAAFAHIVVLHLQESVKQGTLDRFSKPRLETVPVVYNGKQVASVRNRFASTVPLQSVMQSFPHATYEIEKLSRELYDKMCPLASLPGTAVAVWTSQASSADAVYSPLSEAGADTARPQCGLQQTHENREKNVALLAYYLKVYFRYHYAHINDDMGVVLRMQQILRTEFFWMGIDFYDPMRSIIAESQTVRKRALVGATDLAAPDVGPARNDELVLFDDPRNRLSLCDLHSVKQLPEHHAPIWHGIHPALVQAFAEHTWTSLCLEWLCADRDRLMLLASMVLVAAGNTNARSCAEWGAVVASWAALNQSGWETSLLHVACAYLGMRFGYPYAAQLRRLLARTRGGRTEVRRAGATPHAAASLTAPVTQLNTAPPPPAASPPPVENGSAPTAPAPPAASPPPVENDSAPTAPAPPAAASQPPPPEDPASECSQVFRLAADALKQLGLVEHSRRKRTLRAIAAGAHEVRGAGACARVSCWGAPLTPRCTCADIRLAERARRHRGPGTRPRRVQGHRPQPGRGHLPGRGRGLLRRGHRRSGQGTRPRRVQWYRPKPGRGNLPGKGRGLLRRGHQGARRRQPRGAAVPDALRCAIHPRGLRPAAAERCTVAHRRGLQSVYCSQNGHSQRITGICVANV